jgi:hypothetical protein
MIKPAEEVWRSIYEAPCHAHTPTIIHLGNASVAMLSISFLSLIFLLGLCTIAQCSLKLDLNNNTTQNSGSSTSVSISADVNSSAPLPWLSPEYKWFFEYELPIPPVKQPKLSVERIRGEPSKLIVA